MLRSPTGPGSSPAWDDRAGAATAAAAHRAVRRLWDRFRQAMAAERLHAHHGADHVAVDVLVAGGARRDRPLDRLVDATVHTEGQAEAGIVHRSNHRLHVVAPIAQHMQDRAEHLAGQVGDGVDLDRSAARRCRASVSPPKRRPVDVMASCPHALDVLVGVPAAHLGDHWPTSTVRRSGLPRPSSAIAPLSIGTTRSAMSSCRQSRRSAEQRWPAESKADVSVVYQLLGQRR